MKLANIIWGILLVVVGVIFGLNTLEITDINLFFNGWWTLFIIIPCFIDLFKEKDKTGNLIGIGIGVFLLLACQGIVSFDLLIDLMFPAILVVIGFSLIFKDTFNSKVKKKVRELDNKGKKNEYCATFGGQDLVFNDEEFFDSEISSVFGSVKCDLTDAILKDETLIDVSAIFGAVELTLPDDVVVKVTSTPIFGGVSDKRKKSKKGNKNSQKTIYINALCMFGGVDIK